MRLGLIGAGNMARALARGWNEPILCTDAFPGRAQALVDEVGGEAVATNAELAERVDVLILCHKPAGLGPVADEVAGRARGVVSILGGVPLAEVKRAYSGAPVVRILPSTPVEVARGVCVHARDPEADAAHTEAVLERFGRLGPVVTLDEALVDVAMGLMSNAPAYYALLAEAQVDAGVGRGLPADVAARLVVGTMAGTAALIDRRAMDTLAVRREVTSPGGSTARGLAALERHGVRAAFAAALDAVLDPEQP
ncbi:MAG: NAD(P)-binding domain-containing protein [Actinomycetota bacterium]|jgi:pyrroline-5-carboxylate reductase|nr:NAD(P)-binding domain-containing protein [Solirubrobacterales bacterium]MDQ3093070.1 NAD(P)-binding domain-containing protein [Actinomycetota bacterium]MDQ3409728.1 NAD(P)-binding domain-containing protein [Actinomycetota bacterium]